MRLKFTFLYNPCLKFNSGDPGIDGERDWIRDSTYAIMSEHAHEIRIVDFSDPTTIYEELDSLIELD